MIIDLTDAAEHLNVTTEDDGVVILNAILAAQAWLETFLGVPLDYLETGSHDEEDVAAYGEQFESNKGTAPEPLRQAVRMIVGHMYENREAVLVGVSAQALPFGVHDLIAPYRCWTF